MFLSDILHKQLIEKLFLMRPSLLAETWGPRIPSCNDGFRARKSGPVRPVRTLVCIYAVPLA